ncbi:DUF4783 domain-containing protein [Algoriphagus sp. CAU 1675]|uniref:DUF4783 domain-containing protein n=1 Tax=Algoriphagus sp. CAU 1675 TaxID=3032597 RepID=UPI0023D97B33|nr:DUF4783 domain-containing protein [Algoriphagus sp. CAU 1675]MDF2156335.1 DUF4783 domain-containing protein [Algoriphagus sp. CAU 1675]
MLPYHLILSILLWLAIPLRESKIPISIDPVVSAIDAGSVNELAGYFDSSIFLNINGQTGDFSRNQAEIILRDFFKKNPPMGFSLVFRDENNPSLSSYIGDYQSGQFAYRVFIKVNQQDNRPKVYSLGFVKV